MGSLVGEWKKLSLLEQPKVLLEASAQLHALSEERQRAIAGNMESLKKNIDTRLQGELAEWQRTMLKGMVEQERKTLRGNETNGVVGAQEKPSVAGPVSSGWGGFKAYSIETASSIAKDFREGSNWVKAGYIAGGIFGFLAVRALWRKLFGYENSEGEKKEGWFAKGAKWLLSLGGAVGAVLGIHALRTTPEGTAIREGAEALGGTGKGAGTQAVESGIGLLGVAKEIPALAAGVYEKLRMGDTKGALREAFDHGWVFFKSGGQWLLQTGEDAIVLPVQSYRKLGEVLMGKEELDSDFWILYGEAGAAYIIGRTVFIALSQGRLPPSLLGLGVRTAVWPLVQIKDGVVVVSHFVTREGRKLLVVRAEQGPLVRLGKRFFEGLTGLERGARSGNVATMERAIRRWRTLQDQCDLLTAHRSSRLLGDVEGMLKRVTERRLQLARAIHDGAAAHTVNENTPRWLQKLTTYKNEKQLHMFEEALGSPEIQDLFQTSSSVIPRETQIGARAAGEIADTASDVGPNLRIASGTDAVDDVAETAARSAGRATHAREEARKLLRGLEQGDTLLDYKPVKYLLNTGDAEEVGKLLHAAHQAHGPAGAKRAANYLLALKKDAPAAMSTPEVVTKIASGEHGDPSAIGRFLSRGVRLEGEITVESCTKALEQMTHWQKAGKVTRGLYFLGAAAEVGFLGLEIYNASQEYQKEKEERDALQRNVRNELLRLGLKPDSNDPDTYTGSGVTVSIKALSDINPTDFEASLTRAGIATGSLILTLCQPSIVLGPGALVVSGAVIVAVVATDTFWKAVEEGRQRDFLIDAPPWLLLALGVQRSTGASEYDWLTKASSWMLSDLILHNGADKPGIQKKMLFAIFSRDLGENAPEILEEIFGDVEPHKVLDCFYEEDFQKIILPAFKVCLFQKVREDGVSWENIREGDIDSGLVFVPPRATFVEVRAAMRGAAILYLHHLREKGYLEYRELQKKHEDRSDISDLVSAMGEMNVFGGKVKDVPGEVFAKNQGKTRAEVLLDTLLIDLNRGNMQKLDFVSFENLLTFIDDPATRMKLGKVSTETLEEEAAEKRQRWNDWGGHLSEAATYLSDARIREVDAIKYSLAFAGANNVMRALGKPPVHENKSLLDLFGRDANAASYDTAKNAITEGTAELLAREEMPDFREAPKRAEENYKNAAHVPLVFVAGGAPETHFRVLARPPFASSPDKAFSDQHLAAVFFEGKSLVRGGDDSVLLATYIYGDLASDRVSVLQCAAVSATLARTSTIAETGKIQPMTVRDFASTPRGVAMLEQAQQAFKVRQEEAEKRKKEWEAAAPEREQQQKEMQKSLEEEEKKNLDDASDRAKKEPGVFMRITGREPPTYVLFHAGYLIMHIRQSDGSSMSAAPELSSGKTTLKPEENNAITFQNVPNAKGELHNERIWGASYLGDHSERVILRALVTAPYEHEDEKSLRRVLDLFPADIYRPRLYGSMRAYKSALLQALQPLYEKTPLKRKAFFLNELFGLLENKKGITARSSKEIQEWFEGHKKVFGIE